MDEGFRRLPLRRVEEHRLERMARDQWPATVPAVRRLLDDGLDLGALTVLVGENGSGKSTIAEAVAEAYGLPSSGGTQNANHRVEDPVSPLSAHLQLIRGQGSRQGVFLRAETMHDHFSYLDGIEGRETSHGHNAQSHGESFVEFFTGHAGFRGLWIFDEVESALSFQGCLALLAHIRELLGSGSQVILSTHSPVLAALPEATIYELDQDGFHRADYDDLTLTRSWRSFLDSPARYLRHL